MTVTIPVPAVILIATASLFFGMFWPLVGWTCFCALTRSIRPFAWFATQLCTVQAEGFRNTAARFREKQAAFAAAGRHLDVAIMHEMIGALERIAIRLDESKRTLPGADDDDFGGLRQ